MSFPSTGTEWEDEPTPGAEPEVEVDPLASLDETQQAALTARIQTARQEEASVQEQRYQRTIGKHGHTVRKMREMGFDLTEEGDPVPRDLNALQQSLARSGFLGQSQTPAAPQVEEPPDVIMDPTGYHAWTERRIVSGIDTGVKQALGPLMEQIQQLTAAVSENSLPQTTQPFDLAKSTLSEYGQAGLEATPEFQEAFRKCLEQVPVGQRRSEESIETATLLAMRYANKAGVKPAAPAPNPAPSNGVRQTPQAAAVAASRAGLTPVSNGGHASTRAEISPRTTNLAQALKLPPELAAAAQDDSGNAIRKWLKDARK